MKPILLLLLFLLAANVEAIDRWEQKTNFPAIGRHRLNSFAIKGKGYVGLGHINSVVNIALADIWEYDPATDSWTQKADFGGGRRYHCLSFSVGNKGYVGCGRDEFSQFQDFWEFDPTTNIWTRLNDYPGGDRLGPLAFIIDDIAYCGLGSGGTNTTDFWRYTPSNDSWTPIATFPGANRNTGVAFGLEGKGYVGTGNGSFGTSNDFWEYKPSADQWIRRADVGPTNRQGATGFALNGRGYILTGNNWVSNFDDVWEFNPGSNTWEQLEDFPGSDRRFMTSFIIGNKAYCASGTNGTNFNDFWQFDPVGKPVFRMAERVIINTYPNPATDQVNFDFTESGWNGKDEWELRLSDISGRQVATVPITDYTITLYRSTDWQNGVYVYQVFNSNEQLFAHKILFN